MGVRGHRGSRGLLPISLAVGFAGVVAFAVAGAQAQSRPGLSGVAVPSPVISGNGFADEPAISADGRFVAFDSDAIDLVSGPAGVGGVFVRDLAAGKTERVSVSGDGGVTDGSSLLPAISADGRFVAFWSTANDLISGETTPCAGIDCRSLFVRDRLRGESELVSVSSSGVPANAGGYDRPAISADGRIVAFSSEASNLVPGDTNGTFDVFVRDRVAGTTEPVSVGVGGVQASGSSSEPAISADGRFVAFASNAHDLVPGDTNGTFDVFVRDRLTGRTERVSVASDGEQGNDGSVWPAISADGRFVAFQSIASNLVPGDTNDLEDVFVHDRLTGTTERVSVASDGEQATPFIHPGTTQIEWPTISGDGRFVAFYSNAQDLVPGDTSGQVDVFVHDRLTGTTERVSVGVGGVQANGSSSEPAISADGRFVAFASGATNLVAGYRPTKCALPGLCGVEVFLRDRSAGTTSLVSAALDLQPRAGPLALRPWPARAGHRLTATMPVSAAGAPLADAVVACTATLAGRLLPSAQSLRASNARCVWKIPAGAHGKRLTGSLVATTANGTARRHFAGTIH